ncbi:hypothetical protein OSSY52_11760 [Tepiditoga spiralis]|uniref:DNA methylase N-4/N-6 domain-containing protein n=1 Tax=Tepiditoga spiralis TaxID=2108365 RepID=A0A7G1G4K3_9BACT|nr:DNA methyltransferase [Tepiditoga spiralis]BBE31035.1 hypothetical protein OSSY52_11760 [Tepiditoga spiralis]
MYPRLYIAKQLLKDDGVIFVSIDDNEVAQLRILMDEIFGEENFIALAPRKTGAGSAATRSKSELRKLNDYVFIYKKSEFTFKPKLIGVKKFPLKDSFGKYLLAQFQASGSDATRSARPNMFYPIYELEDGTLTTIKKGKIKKIILPNKVNGEDGRWLWNADKFEKDNKRFIHYDNGKIQRKIYFDSSKDNNIYQVEKAWFEQYRNADGTKRFNYLFKPFKALFSNPKPIELIIHLINLINDNNEKNMYILDFFAGSGTTGDAVMQLNAEDNGNRKYILVQLPEEIDKKKNKTAYDFVKNELKIENPTIFDITKERLIRAGEKIQEENKDRPASSKKVKCEGYNGNGEHCPACKGKYTIKIEATKKKDLSNVDFGFKIFETIPNYEGVWENYLFKAEEFDPQLKLFDETELSDEDLKTLLITWKTYDGIPLTKNLKEIDLDGYTGYYFDTKLYLVNKGFTTKSLKRLLEEIDKKKDFNPASIIAFGYNFESKSLREIADNVKSYANKKQIDIDFIARY